MVGRWRARSTPGTWNSKLAMNSRGYNRTIYTMGRDDVAERDDETSRAWMTADQEMPFKLAIVRLAVVHGEFCSAQCKITGSVRVGTARSVEAKDKGNA
jgi:hypothetical protein